MRAKIIAMSSVVVLLVGFLSYFLAKGAVATAAGTSSQVMAEAKRSSQTSAVRVQHDGLRTERWLSTRVNDPSLLDVMGKGTPQARADAATQASDSIMAAAKTTPVFGGVVPSIILIVDSQGLVVGRNGTGTGRGDNLAALYPGRTLVVRAPRRRPRPPRRRPRRPSPPASRAKAWRPTRARLLK